VEGGTREGEEEEEPWPRELALLQWKKGGRERVSEMCAPRNGWQFHSRTFNKIKMKPFHSFNQTRSIERTHLKIRNGTIFLPH